MIPVYIAIMAVGTFLIRALPLTIFRRPIRNRFLRSFLYYVPYITLAAMTFPAILQDASSPLAGGLALLCGIVLAWFGGGLFRVALACCAVVILVYFFPAILALL